MRKRLILGIATLLTIVQSLTAQIDIERVMTIGKNALYFKDYVVSMGYFNQVIFSRPWMAEPYYYRAVAKISLDDYQGALDDAAACIERNAFIPRAYLLRGIGFQQDGKLEEAIADYRKGLSLTPNDEGMLINLSIALNELKEYDQAEQQCKILQDFYPKSKQALLINSNIALGRKDTVAAITALEKLIEKDSLYAAAYGQLSLLHYNQKQYDKALKFINKAIEIEPEENAFYTNRGLLRYQQNDLKGAMDDYSHVLRSDPQDRVARFNRALLRANIGDSNNAIEDFDAVIEFEKDNYHALYNRALLLVEVGEYRRAIADYDKVLKKYPKFMLGFHARSQAKRALNDLRGADLDYWHAIDLERSNKGAAKTTEHNKNESGDDKDTKKETREDSDETIEKYQMLVVAKQSKNKKDLYSSQIRGRVQDQDVEVQARPAFTLSYYRKTIQSEMPRNYYAQALDRYNTGKNAQQNLLLVNDEQALTAEQIAKHEEQIKEISIDMGSNAKHYLDRGIAYMLLQNLEQAIADFDQAIINDPQMSLAYFSRAVARNKWMEAKRGSSLLSGETQAMGTTAKTLITASARKNSMGVDIASQPKEQKAILGNSNVELELILRDLEKTIELDPNFAYAFYNRALLGSKMGNIDEAISDYTKAIEANPKFADAYFNRGLLYLSAGKAQDGIADLSHAGQFGLYQAYNIIKRMNKK